MAKQKVKIALLGSMKEFQTEVDDKKKFTKEIEELIQNGGMYWIKDEDGEIGICLLYTSPSPRDQLTSRMPSSA